MSVCLQKEIQADFDAQGVDVLTGCVGALDGIAIKIERPSLNDVKNPKQFYNRKGFHALVLQAVCDQKRRFLFASAKHPGATHDSRAFKASSLYKVSGCNPLNEARVLTNCILIIHHNLIAY